MNKFLMLSIVLCVINTKSYAFEFFDNSNGFFDDTTPAQPIDGNYGETIGQQRVVAVLYIEDYLKSIFNISVPVKIKINFNSLSPNLLAYASPYYHFNKNAVPNLPLFGVYYPESLANQYAGYDLLPSTLEIEVTVGNNPNYYYGFSSAPPGKANFMGLMLHEVIHGLGFYDNIDDLNGGLGSIPVLGLASAPTVWDYYLWDESAYYPDIPDWWLYSSYDMQVATLLYSINNLWFSGISTRASIQNFRNNQARTFDYSFNNTVPVQLNDTGGLGQYVHSHFDEGLIYNHEVMEPIDDPLDPDNHIGLAKYSLQDLGWPIHSSGDRPIISDIEPAISVFISDSQDVNITQFAVWDNDNEAHLVNDYGFPVSTNPWHPMLYVGVSASSSNQNVLSDNEFTVYCALSNPNAGFFNESCEIYDLDISAGSGAVGLTVITINALDADGNSDSESFILNLSTNTIPQIQITSPSDGHTFLTTQQILSATASDVEDGINLPIDWCYRIIGGEWLCYNNLTGDLTVSAIDGQYQVAACVTDIDNNTECDGITVTVAALVDFDNDGIDNSTEVSFGTDPYNNDSDNDGLLDGNDPEPLVPEAEDFNIPAMGGIGLLALGLSMLGLGAVRLRK